MIKITVLLIFGVLSSSRSEEARFFRVCGPVATTITGTMTDGYVIWTNSPVNAVFTVQIAQSLAEPSSWVDYVKVAVTNSTTSHRLFDPHPTSAMAFVPAGIFTMGDTFEEGLADETPTHSVHVSAFYLDKAEVSGEKWLGVHKWAVTNGYIFDNPGSFKSPTHPVQMANWWDAVKWCNARSEKEGLRPCYYADTELTLVYRNYQGPPYQGYPCVDWEADGYRLPTEAEWEKAARGGLTGRRFPWSDTDDISHSKANYCVYQQDGTNRYAYDKSYATWWSGYHPVFETGDQPYTSEAGFFPCNGYGLYDMAGNVWEWCWDFWQSDWYSQAEATQSDTHGPDLADGFRVIRGGAWVAYAFHSRCAWRSGFPPVVAYNDLGFRCVRR